MTMPPSSFRSVAVVGAGVMGAGIAAHIANARIPVFLLDVPQKGDTQKNTLAEAALKKLKQEDPSPLMHLDRLNLITPGNIEDLDQIRNVDWVIEAVVENKEVKQALYKRLEAVCQTTTIFSSNTSTLPLKRLIEGQSPSFQERFLITHFFNPPRFMHLLEVVKGPKTKTNVLEAVIRFASDTLGKGVISCFDTPGFVANRIGTFWIQTAFLTALETGITVEEADALMGKPLGFPKTGVFGLMDLVGLDLIPFIGKNMKESLPSSDPYVRMFQEPEILQKMIEEGLIGRKGKGGFYRLTQASDGTKIKEALNLKTGEYAPVLKPRLVSLESGQEGLKRLFMCKDPGGFYAWQVMSHTLSYAASLVSEIAESPLDIDRAMRWGYRWKKGPFEILDQVGPDWFAERLRQEGREVPEILRKIGKETFYKEDHEKRFFFNSHGEYKEISRHPGILLLEDIKRNRQPLLKNSSAQLWDIGEGVVCLEFTSKMNAIDPFTFEIIFKTVALISDRGYKALVIYNEGSHFSAGADLGWVLFGLNLGLWDQIEKVVENGQKAFQALKYAPFPVVGAPSGLALGGGCEILLHCDFVQAHAETYMGLVEVGVGLVPAWGGCQELLGRWLASSKQGGGSMASVIKVFEIIGTAKVSQSADEARDLLFLLSDRSEITMNRDHLLAHAKEKALNLAQNYCPPEKSAFSLPGKSAQIGMKIAVQGMVNAGKATLYDQVVVEHLAQILSGGDTDIQILVPEDTLLTMERQAFMTLIRDPRTWSRMEHTLETGKPLRN